MNNCKQNANRRLDNLEHSNRIAKEILRRRDNPTQAEWDADQKIKFETEEAKSFRVFERLDHLQFCQRIKQTERRFIKKLCDICDRALA